MPGNALFVLNELLAPRLAPRLATEIGLNESILLLQIEFWIRISGREIDGKRWVYESLTDIKEAFPFWSKSTINRIIHSLEEKQLIEVGNYNRAKYDRTRWLCLDPVGCSKLTSVVLAEVPTQNETTLCHNDTTIPDLSTEKEREEHKNVATATPHTFQGWHIRIKEAENDKDRIALLRWMCEILYPGLDPPSYGYIGKVAKKLHAGRLADLLWQCAPHPPTGDLLAYIQGAAKNGNRNNGKRESEPVEQAIGWVDE